jgi:hypothetical protein
MVRSFSMRPLTFHSKGGNRFADIENPALLDSALEQARSSFVCRRGNSLIIFLKKMGIGKKLTDRLLSQTDQIRSYEQSLKG